MSDSDSSWWHKEVKNVKEFKKEVVTYLAPVTKFNRVERYRYTNSLLIENNSNLAEVDRKTFKKIKKNHIEIDYTLDLHGFSQVQARNLLVETVNKCFNKNYRVILVITGKGNNSEGVLKKSFLDWINQDDIKYMISGFSLSAEVHGGSGAYYLLLKKPKNSFDKLTFLFS